MTTLGKKLLLGLGVPAVLLLLLGVAVQWRRTSDAVHAATWGRARQLAERVAAAFEVPASQSRASPEDRHSTHRPVGELVRSDPLLLLPVKNLRIVDRDGRILWSRDPALVGSRATDAGRLLAALTEPPSLDEKRGELLQPLGGASCIGCHEGDGARMGLLQIELDKPELQEHVNAAFVDGLRWVVVVALILTSAILLSMHYFLTRPLRRLAEAMQRAEQGDLLVRARVTSQDEVGRLAAGFNRMLARMTAMKAEELETQRDLAQAQAQLEVQKALARTNAVLERRLNALSLLYDVARSLTATLELPNLLARISQLVVSRLKIDHFSVMLLEPEGRLVVKVALPRGRGTEEMSFELGEGAAGKAAATLQSVYVPDTAADEGTFARRSPHLARGALLCVPMIHQNTVLGVLNFERPSPESFNPEEMELLTAVADQAAMAVKNARLHAETVALSITDPLTGAPNRRHLFARLEMEIARAHRFGTAVSLLMVDIDHFKALNDTAGHRAGDVTLRQVSDLIRSIVRKVDTLGRYGGEEFVLVLPQIQRPEAVEAAEKIRRAVEDHPFTHRSAQANSKITISVGVATLSSDANSLEKLVDCADAALYASKRGGRNRVTSYEPGMESHPGRERGPHAHKRKQSSEHPITAPDTTAPPAGGEKREGGPANAETRS